jgi:hypothetical protein
MTTRPDGTLRNRLFWFAVLWLAGVGVVSAIAYLIRLMIGL